MSLELDGELELGSLKGLSLSIRAVFVPDTGRPRILSCCLSSGTCQRQHRAGLSYCKRVFILPHIYFISHIYQFSRYNFNFLVWHIDTLKSFVMKVTFNGTSNFLWALQLLLWSKQQYVAIESDYLCMTCLDAFNALYVKKKLIALAPKVDINSTRHTTLDNQEWHKNWCSNSRY